MLGVLRFTRTHMHRWWGSADRSSLWHLLQFSILSLPTISSSIAYMYIWRENNILFLTPPELNLCNLYKAFCQRMTFYEASLHATEDAYSLACPENLQAAIKLQLGSWLCRINWSNLIHHWINEFQKEEYDSIFKNMPSSIQIYSFIFIEGLGLWSKRLKRLC